MKQIFTLAAMLFLGLAANGQYSDLKSTQGLRQALDSMDLNYWDSYNEQWDSTRYYFEYNATGQMTLFYTTYKDNSTGDWLGEDRNEYNFNSKGNIIEYLYLQWDEDISDWETDTRKVYSYSSSGNQAGYVSYDWDDIGEEWIRDDSIHYYYNDERLLTEYTGAEWKTDHWVGRYLSEYSYNAQGLLSEQISRMWYEDDQEWKNNIKYVMTWNEQGQLLTKIRYDQDVYDGPWLEEYKQELSYNAKHLRTISSSAHWESDQWEIYRYDTVEYNTSGLPTENRGYYLDEGIMRPDYMHEYSFDASGNLVEYIVSNWDKNAMDLVLYGKSNYSYDLDYTVDDLLLPSDSDWESDLNMDYVLNMPLGIHAYQWINDSWEDYKLTKYFYSPRNVEGVGVEYNELAMARLYPNPVSEMLYVALEEGFNKATLSIYELTGRQVLRRQLNTDGAVSLAALPAGVYLYSLTVDGKIQSGKLMKR